MVDEIDELQRLVNSLVDRVSRIDWSSHTETASSRAVGAELARS